MKFITTLALTLTVITGNAFAGEGKGKGERFAKFQQELALSNEQMEKLKAMREESNGQSQKLREEIKATRKEMKEAFAADADEAKLKALHTKLRSQQNKISDLRFNKMLKMRSILTPEQRKKFHSLKKDKWGQKREGRKHGHKHGNKHRDD